MAPNLDLPLRRQREDGWTPRVQAAFITALIEGGSVRMAANAVDRHVTSAYRLRRRVPAFANAWDTARRSAYARLRDEAMERAINDTPEDVWHAGRYVGTRRVRNDRLLIALLAQLKHETPPGGLWPCDVDTIEDALGNAVGSVLEMLGRRQPARGRIVESAVGQAPATRAPTLST